MSEQVKTYLLIYCVINCWGIKLFRNTLLNVKNNVFLSSIITKQILPQVLPMLTQTNAFTFDTRRYLMLIYWLFTECQLTYQMLIFKQQKQEYFCTLSHKCKNKAVKEFLSNADSLFIGELSLQEFVDKVDLLRES